MGEYIREKKKTVTINIYKEEIDKEEHCSHKSKTYWKLRSLAQNEKLESYLIYFILVSAKLLWKCTFG